GWCYVCVGDCPGSRGYIDKVLRVAEGPAYFVGFQDDIGSALNAADAAFLVSTSEGCSLAGLECHASRVPLVASPIGLYAEHPELIRAIPHDADRRVVREAILETLTDPEAACRRVEAAHAWVARHHTPGEFHRRWDALLGSIAPPRDRFGPGARA